MCVRALSRAREVETMRKYGPTYLVVAGHAEIQVDAIVWRIFNPDRVSSYLSIPLQRKKPSFFINERKEQPEHILL